GEGADDDHRGRGARARAAARIRRREGLRGRRDVVGPQARGSQGLALKGSLAPMNLEVHPLTPERWPDLEAIFDARGCSVARGCWCMYYRLSGERGAFPSGTTRAQAAHAEFRALVDAGKMTGLIGYRGGEPVGWISFGPRAGFAKPR